MVYEGINFYPSLADKSFADFQKHESHHGLPNEQLKEAYELLKKSTGQAVAKEEKQAENKKEIEDSSL